MDTVSNCSSVLNLIGEQHENAEMCVTFTKTDGSTRNMRCSFTDPNATPTDIEVASSRANTSTAVQRVFDLDKQAWRSFRFDSVIRIEFTLQVQ